MHEKIDLDEIFYNLPDDERWAYVDLFKRLNNVIKGLSDQEYDEYEKLSLTIVEEWSAAYDLPFPKFSAGNTIVSVFNATIQHIKEYEV